MGPVDWSWHGSHPWKCQHNFFHEWSWLFPSLHQPESMLPHSGNKMRFGLQVRKMISQYIQPGLIKAVTFCQYVHCCNPPFSVSGTHGLIIRLTLWQLMALWNLFKYKYSSSYEASGIFSDSFYPRNFEFLHTGKQYWVTNSYIHTPS